MAVETAPPSGRPKPERLTIRPDTYRTLVDVTLAALTLIIFTGAAVRLTGSGLGCPDWPKCEGRLVLQLGTHIWIEFGNRLLSGTIGIPCVLVGVLAFRRRPFRRDLVWPAVLLGVGVVTQGVLGGLTVIFDLHWQLVIAHYLLSMAMLVAGALLAWRVRRDPGEAPPSHARGLVRATRAVGAAGAAIIVAGTFATAAGPHAGGAGTNDVVERLDAFGTGTLKSLIYLHGHPAAVLGFLCVALWFAARRGGASPTLQRALTAVCVLIAAQGALGLAQYHLALPAEIVWAHASLAAVLWLSFVWAVLAAGRSVTASYPAGT